MHIDKMLLLILYFMRSVPSPVVMATDPLAEAGFHFDDLNKLRVLDPEVGQKTSELKEECKEFVDSKASVSTPEHILFLLFSWIGKCNPIYPAVAFFSDFAEIGQFQKIVGGLIELVDELAKEAETEKMKVREAIQHIVITSKSKPL